jgi:putative endopeptidase
VTKTPLSLALASALFLVACGSQEPATTSPTAPQAAAPAAPARLQIDQSKLPPLPAFSASDLDPSVPACVDLDKHVNAKWQAANPIPAERTTWGSFEMLQERSREVQKQIAEAAAADPAASGNRKLIGDIWATGMDEAAIEAAGIAPIQPFLAEIDALTTTDDLVTYLREAPAKGRASVFGMFAESDFVDSSKVIAYVAGGGLSLPDKTYYVGDEHAEAREGFRAHVAQVLELAGTEAAQAAEQADRVLALETMLAEVSYSREELSRDISKYYNPVSLADADALTPSFSWSEFFAANGVADPGQFSLSNPDFFIKVSELYSSVPMDDWKTYLRFHTIDSASPYLSEAFANQNFNFYGKTLRGQEEQLVRWKRVLNFINGTVGEALGELYVEVAFPPESKAQMEQLVDNLGVALKARLDRLEWMTPATREKALEKWASFEPKIGYPDQWRDWSGLSTSRDSLVANILAANAFNQAWQMAKIGKPKDRSEWGMTPQTVNASYNPLMNQITFPAAILQPPFFDPNADPALNYGGIGAVIGHEMLHGYDDQGSRFDARGSFVNWWQPEDSENFANKTRMLVEQFDAYQALPGKPVNGNLTLGENIADLGGLTVSFDAMKLANGPDYVDPMVDEMTQDQRFFISWATVWRRLYTEKELTVRLVTDSHAPARYRANGAPQNMPAFAEAFGCSDSDPMVRAGEQRIAIW